MSTSVNKVFVNKMSEDRMHANKKYVNKKINLDKYDCVVIVGDCTNRLYEKTCQDIGIPKCFQWEQNIDYLITQIIERQELLNAKKHESRLLVLYTDGNELLRRLKGYVHLVKLTNDVYFTGELNSEFKRFGNIVSID